MTSDSLLPASPGADLSKGDCNTVKPSWLLRGKERVKRESGQIPLKAPGTTFGEGSIHSRS